LRKTPGKKGGPVTRTTEGIGGGGGGKTLTKTLA